MPGEKIGVIHYGGDGAGHAMRMLAVAQKAEEKGFDVEITGGGPGRKFLRMNGRSEFSPRNIHFVKDLHEENFAVAMKNMPLSAYGRIKDLRSWIRDSEIDVLVVDDSLAAIAAILERKKFYFLSHWTWQLPGTVTEKASTFIFHRTVLGFCEDFFCPAMWKEKPPGATRVGPLAPEGETREIEDFDVLVVPSAVQDVTGEIVEELEENGYSVRKVGSENWEPKPSLQPYIKKADLIVCSGYSTVMEASVAGTPCVILPTTSEQRGVMDRLEEYEGFRRFSGDIIEDLEKISKPEKYENGAEEIAEKLFEDLS
jgi:UDP:flavonoid glycosyltransferase YjiC (YdhE family)